jgi:hypothetical protein
MDHSIVLLGRNGVAGLRAIKNSAPHVKARTEAWIGKFESSAYNQSNETNRAHAGGAINGAGGLRQRRIGCPERRLPQPV